MHDITYYILHCKEFTERLPNIAQLQQIFSKKINNFNGYYTRYNSLEKNEQIKFLKSIDNHLQFNKDFIFNKTGQIGCYLSHHMLIRQILIENKTQGYSVIFEDDILPTDKNMEYKINNVLDSLKNTDFDIVFLGNVNDNHGVHVVNNIYQLDTNNYCWGAHAMLINNANVRKLFYHNCFINHEIDNHYKQLIDKKTLLGYVVYPPICFQNWSLESNIKTK